MYIIGNLRRLERVFCLFFNDQMQINCYCPVSSDTVLFYKFLSGSFLLSNFLVLLK